VIQGVGPDTAHPDTQIYNTDRNNFAPALGLTWAVPGDGIWKWLSGGPNKMTIRMGYGVGFQRYPISLANTESGTEPGISETQTLLTATNLSQVPCRCQAAYRLRSCRRAARVHTLNRVRIRSESALALYPELQCHRLA